MPTPNTCPNCGAHTHWHWRPTLDDPGDTEPTEFCTNCYWSAP